MDGWMDGWMDKKGEEEQDTSKAVLIKKQRDLLRTLRKRNNVGSEDQRQLQASGLDLVLPYILPVICTSCVTYILNLSFLTCNLLIIINLCLCHLVVTLRGREVSGRWSAWGGAQERLILERIEGTSILTLKGRRKDLVTQGMFQGREEV
jgi:hypothetical protein